MKYFDQVKDLPVLDLYTDLSTMLVNGTVDFSSFNQISLNTIPSRPSDFKLSTGSLHFDWQNTTEIINSDGTVKRVPSKHAVPLKEEDFTVLCDQFKGTVFETVYQLLSTRYKLGRVRIMKMGPRYCMSWHTDISKRLHYPIKTQSGCFMVINDEIMHIPQNEWWMTDTYNYHTAFNGSNEDRLHLVAVILD